MKCLPAAWSGRRVMETYTYNDRQVARIVALSIGFGVLLGISIATLLHIKSAW